jgi:mannose-6-phosphate isomerase-like protein (cupin superfamily)
VTADFAWSDLGGWKAVAAFLPADAAGNRFHARLAARDASRCIVYCERPDETVSLIGVSDIVVARSDGRTLVSALERTDEVKQLLADTPDLASNSAATGTVGTPSGFEEDHRPWGWYRVLEDAPGHKVKRIVVYPGKRLSLQRHTRREEHWYIVLGSAVVTRDNERIPLEPGGAVDISRGAAHRIENPGADDLAFIEVQTGEYFGEDDIERIEDDYGRA